MSTHEATARILGRHKALVGMIHLRALPGTPRSSMAVGEVARIAAEEARLLAGCGFDALLIENMHDAPYLNGAVGPEITSAMTACALAVRAAAPDTPLGVQTLAGANREALAVAHASGANFIRAENFVYAHIADEGLMPEASAGPLLRYRKAIGAESVAILADIKKKHAAHAVTADISLGQAAQGAAFFGADAVIVTGSATGHAVHEGDLAEAHEATTLPVVIGSGATPDRAAALLHLADAIIVGSSIKHGGVWSNDIDHDRARAMVKAVDEAR
ncbi:MAG: BtpA/SgcQ family protein [Phycisphaerales bacterium]